MSDQLITCPSCGKKFPLDQAFSHQIEEQIRAEFAERMSQTQAAHEGVLVDLRAQMDSRIAQREKEVKDEAERKAAEEAAIELQNLREELQGQSRKLREAREAELSLRKRERELQEKSEMIELQMERERALIRDQVATEITESTRMRLAEKDKKLGDLSKQVDDLKTRLEQGSQQMQGEVMELELERVLEAAFPSDQIDEVPKGVRGADVLQRVCVSGQPTCGSILWESKRTKAFSSGWISKLEEDRRQANADAAVIVATVLPEDVNRISHIKGIWVTDFASCIGFATVLRAGIIKVASARAAGQLQSEEMELIRKYLSSGEFSDRVEAIAQAFIEMKSELETEKRAFERIWKKREAQLDRGLLTTAHMYGALDGMLGDALPELPTLELPG